MPSTWPWPRQHSQGPEPELQRAGAKGSHPPTLPMLLPPGKGLSEQHQRGRQLPAASEPFGFKSLESEEKEKGREDRWGMGGTAWGHRKFIPRCASTVPHATLNSPSAKGYSSHLTGEEAEARRGTGFARF